MQAARQPQCILHLQPVFHRSILKLEMAEHVVGFQREPLLRSDEVKMRVAGTGRQLELRLWIASIDRRRQRPLHICRHWVILSHATAARPAADTGADWRSSRSV